MAESTTEKVISETKKTVTKPMEWLRKNPLAFAFLVLVLLLVFLRFGSKVSEFIYVKASTGSRFWGTVARIAGISVGAVILTVLAGLATGGDQSISELIQQLPVMMAVAFPMCDTFALRDEAGNSESLLTPGTADKERRFNFLAARETFNNFPLMIDAIQGSIKFTLVQAASTASEIPWDALHVQLAGWESRSPRFGLMDRKEDLTGPVMKHMQEFITNGYAYSGDEIISEISATAGNHVGITLYFTRNYTQRCMAKPEEFAMFAGWLQQSQYSMWLAPATQLATLGFSTGATIAGTDVELRMSARYFTRAMHGDVRQAYTVPPLVNHRVIKVAATGQEDITFTGVGGTGPENTSAVAGERIVAMGMLSDSNGLPGVASVADITEIGCEAIGLMFTKNVDHFLLAKLPEPGRPWIQTGSWTTESAMLNYSRGWPWTLPHEDGGTGNPLAESDLMIMPLVLPSKRGTKVTKLFRLKGDVVVHARRATPPTSGMHALYVCGLRDIDPAYGATMLAAAGVSGTTTRNTPNAEQAVAAGQSRASFVGISQKAT